MKARANNRKMQKRIAKQEALFYADMLRQDINADREAHGKKPLKDKDDNNKPGSGGNDKFEDYTDDVPSDEKTIKCSTTDPESGWFRKGEHKHVFAYGIETACDKNGWIIDFTVNPGNEHDSRTFKGLYDKLADIGMKYCIVDAGYKTPAIAKLLLDDGIKPVFPYKRPMTKDGFSGNLSMYMMSIMMLIFVQGITFCITARQIGMDIASIKAVDRFAKSASIFRSVQKARTM